MLMINIPQLHEEFGEKFLIPNGEALLVIEEGEGSKLGEHAEQFSEAWVEGFRHFWSV